MATSTTEQDFFEIKENLKTYLRGQTEFADYDFEGSAMSTLLDVLAFNTHYAAMTANMSVNEMFLDTAQLRSNVVSHARTLGYTPQSPKTSKALVSMSGSYTPSAALTIPRGSYFNAGGQKFITVEDHISSSDLFGAINFDSIKLYEGKLLTKTFIVSSANQKYTIPNKSCDISSLRVTVKSDSTATDLVTYTLGNTLIDVGNTSKVYFLEESDDEKYSIYFGDNLIGKKLDAGNVVVIEYIKTIGIEGNSLNNFSFDSTIPEFKNPRVTTISPSSGGAGIESIDSIKINAPFNFSAQNRAVTISDYRVILEKIYPNSDTISVWGGEDNIPPEYGKVFLSVDTSSNTALTSSEKTSILQELNKFKLTSILPEFVTPDYTNLVLNVKFTFNSLVTSNTATGLSSLISDKIVAFNAELAKFDTSYYNSDIISLVLAADSSIVSATVNHTANKSIASFTNVTSKYTFNFNNAIYHPHEYHTTTALKGVISSDGFNITNSTYTHFLEDDGIGKIKLSYISDTGATVIVNNQIGTVDYTTGEIIINEISISSATLKMNVHLDSYDVIPLRNDIITISDTTISGTQLTSKLGIQTTETNYTASPARL